MNLNKFDLQANILASHKKKYAVHYSFRWKRSKSNENQLQKLRLAWLVEVSSILTYHQESSQDTEVITCLYISYFGYNRLQLPDGIQAPSFPNIRSNGTYNNRPFQEKVHYPSNTPGQNDQNLDNSESDGLLLLASDKPGKIKKSIKKIFKQEYSKIFAHKKARQFWGYRKTGVDQNGKIYSVGPLGFKDGIANPKDERIILRSAVKTADSLVGQISCGSYVAVILIKVFKEKFQQIANKISDQLKVSYSEELAAGKLTLEEIEMFSKALLFGRYENGLPLCNEADRCDEDRLVYLNDLNGYSCPFRSHVRGLNRIDGTRIYEEIVRRGIVWTSPDQPQDELGLIFLSYHRDMKTQLFDSLFTSIEGNRDFIVYSNPNSNLNFQLDVKIPKIEKSARLFLKESDLNFKGYGGEAYYYAPAKLFFDQLQRYLSSNPV